MGWSSSPGATAQVNPAAAPARSSTARAAQRGAYAGEPSRKAQCSASRSKPWWRAMPANTRSRAVNTSAGSVVCSAPPHAPHDRRRCPTDTCAWAPEGHQVWCFRRHSLATGQQHAGGEATDAVLCRVPLGLVTANLRLRDASCYRTSKPCGWCCSMLCGSRQLRHVSATHLAALEALQVLQLVGAALGGHLPDEQRLHRRSVPPRAARAALPLPRLP